MTTFYSPSKGRVAIPKSKVCSYRIKTDLGPRGWTSGLRSGRDNGVVDHKLSRFSTDVEADAHTPCAGNVNWLNHPPQTKFANGNGFRKTRGGTPFVLKRPAHRSNNVTDPERKMPDTQSTAMERAVSRRGGVGNYTITRPAFDAPEVKPRRPIDFDKLQALDIEQAGTKVQLGESTLKQLFDVEVPDPSDTLWLAEKARLTAQYRAQGMNPEQIAEELRVNKPLGRAQRTSTKKRNIAQAELSTADKLNEIKQEIDAGRAQSRAQQATLTGQLALILNDVTAINQLTQQQLTDLGLSLARIGVPTMYSRLGLRSRFGDIAYYNQNAGLINLLLFSKVREKSNTAQYNYDLLVKNFARTPATGLPAMKLTSAVAALGRQGNNRVYLDLERGGVISHQEMIQVVNVLGGWDVPEINVLARNR